MLINKTLKGRAAKPAGGFTMVETLILILIIGIFCAIASPSWLMFINNHRLKVSVDRAYSLMELARSNAKRDKIAWQTSFKQVGENLQVAVHKAEITPAQVPANQWKNLEHKIKIHTHETTLLKVNENNKATGNKTIRRATFNFRGCAVYNGTDECGQTSLQAKGRLTLFHPDLKNSERCVIVSTILGHKRISQRQRKALDGRYCY
ncbi:MAG: transcriptional regulator [Microcoleus sp. PH2017_10_PVI_O_A]|uniref:pilus assembly FimT family protein n=1 Tax=unclassified Microcoleus TaxID=2642155 RepID=UPI001D53EC20|nr:MULTISPECIES: transcriptional regulator [unclassified Microcoleus]TAE82476.1 MAG: transcriptional regulator [Oscillatoriales cyanobacterium]MCC3406169.1 transcriptional regulator [Microcoleus sp. PH2017_10_PVI_O_A]MCC3460760.1 transcriptional regulator [Microcoleus sp. PH2017_11_PCY_U_A]MCC3479323.1 transcriptional regulator [Microcoleus sp. PH2017_12_PCY_D_A]MCC3529113.1 transcriptional regulator [Microcoleus sp. PH2017_21_RUC_O_A]